MDLTFVIDDDLSRLIEGTFKLCEHRHDKVFWGLAISSLVFEKEREDSAFVNKYLFNEPLLELWWQLFEVLVFGEVEVGRALC